MWFNRDTGESVNVGRVQQDCMFSDAAESVETAGTEDPGFRFLMMILR